MANRKPTIVIVGAGFSGCMVAVHLLRQAQQALRVVLIDRDDAPGRGVAYRDQPECHLLNVRAEAMSAFPDQPDHFLDWLNNTYSPCHPVGVSEFLPRRIYGFYIESLLASARQATRRGVGLEFRSDEVLGLRQIEGGQMLLRLRSGGHLRADQLVLALGNPGPADPPLADPDFFRSPRYLGHAWTAPGLNAIRPDEDLLLVGSGLTALDWLAALQARGHRGRIHMLSRRGLLPQPHRPAAPQALSFNPLELPPRVLPLLRRLRAEAAAVQGRGGDWRAVVDALRPFTPALWQRLPPEEQRRFLRHVRPYWEIHRHRAAPRIVDRLHSLVRSGGLQLLAGRLLAFEEQADAVEALVRPRQQAGTLRLRVHRVVNCTGPESNYRRLNHPLIVGLRERGLIQPDSLGLGLLTTAQGALVASDGQASERIHTLGPARKGQLWETTAVPEIRVQAQALALRLLRLAGVDARSGTALRPDAPRLSV
ncbi:MAG: FAD-dependent oxidoreductase [Nevskia sp.]|nr:FAD-dependent oxidoreductase [Nevskia sp.]